MTVKCNDYDTIINRGDFNVHLKNCSVYNMECLVKIKSLELNEHKNNYPLLKFNNILDKKKTNIFYFGFSDYLNIIMNLF